MNVVKHLMTRLTEKKLSKKGRKAILQHDGTLSISCKPRTALSISHFMYHNRAPGVEISFGGAAPSGLSFPQWEKAILDLEGKV